MRPPPPPRPSPRTALAPAISPPTARRRRPSPFVPQLLSVGGMPKTLSRRRVTYDREFKLKVVREALKRPVGRRIRPTCSNYPSVEPCQLRKWIRALQYEAERGDRGSSCDSEPEDDSLPPLHAGVSFEAALPPDVEERARKEGLSPTDVALREQAEADAWTAAAHARFAAVQMEQAMTAGGAWPRRRRPTCRRARSSSPPPLEFVGALPLRCGGARRRCGSPSPPHTPRSVAAAARPPTPPSPPPPRRRRRRGGRRRAPPPRAPPAAGVGAGERRPHRLPPPSATITPPDLSPISLNPDEEGGAPRARRGAPSTSTSGRRPPLAAPRVPPRALGAAHLLQPRRAGAAGGVRARERGRRRGRPVPPRHLQEYGGIRARRRPPRDPPRVKRRAGPTCLRFFLVLMTCPTSHLDLRGRIEAASPFLVRHRRKFRGSAVYI